MKKLLDIPKYAADVKRVASQISTCGQLRGKTILITGGTGLIGSFMIDALLAADIDCKVILLGRSEEKSKLRFAEYFGSGCLTFLKWDASAPTVPQVAGPVDFILHLASNTHPVAYATDPVGTVVMNVCAAKMLLDFAVAKGISRFVYASSVEVYGQNRGDVEKFAEGYCGYIDCNNLRAGYPESKRCGESLCQAYLKQFNLDFVIPRIARVYGPTLLRTDTKALSQFISNAIAGEDIVLKSEGKQYYSYIHVADAVSGILTVLLKGGKGEAYNISDVNSDITLRDLAAIVADTCGRKVVFDMPSAVERSGFSPAMLARLDNAKLLSLGWAAHYDIKSGIVNTIDILREGC